LHEALRGTRLPSRPVVDGFLAACGVSDAQPWLSKWRELRATPPLSPPPSRFPVVRLCTAQAADVIEAAAKVVQNL
jgi:hypothetical protein